MTKLRMIAILFIGLGIIVPRIINAYEEANRLDISRNVGSLPWLILLVVGAVMLIVTFIRKR